jgi:hypothetical protein
MVDIKIVSADSKNDLTLVSEHKMGETQFRKSYMVNGAEPTDELGFVRIVNAPEQFRLGAAENSFVLQVQSNPIEFGPPDCFQAGKPAEFEAIGFDVEQTDNWRLTTNNGSVNGLKVTPARTGKMEVFVEIDSPVTRKAGTFHPVEPEKTRVSLGKFEVIDKDCMVRMSSGNEFIVTFSSIDDYSEFSVPAENVGMYLRKGDVALYDNGWQPIPAQAHPMIVAMFNTNINAQVGPVFDIAHPKAGKMEPFQMHRFPSSFAERFGWRNLRSAPSPDQKPSRRKPAPCIYSDGGCTTADFLVQGQHFSVIFDSMLRPERLIFANITVDFEYGVFKIRRPPGW